MTENTDNDNMVQRWFNRILSIKTAADALPVVLQIVVMNGKMSTLVFLGIYLVLVFLWLPFRLMAYFITELGVYAFIVVTVLFVGRCIIRLLAFPGSSSRVPAEIEMEFARYSVRMVQSSATCIMDLCTAVSSSSPATTSSSGGYHDIPGIWARTKSYRDRVLGMYLDVLMYLYGEPTTDSANSEITKYGNNRISGDIGNLQGLTVSNWRFVGGFCNASFIMLTSVSYILLVLNTGTS